MTTLRLGLLGDPVAHSLSPAIHTAALRELKVNGVYELRRVAAEKFAPEIAMTKALHFQGLNVTIPHKEAAVSVCDELSDEARKIGAVNAIHFLAGRAVGHNTDAWALMQILAREGRSPRRALLIGAGGAARAAAFALGWAGAEVVVVNRTSSRAEALVADLCADGLRARVASFDQLADESAKAEVVIHATSVGLLSNVSPLPPEAVFAPDALVIDLVYRPLETAFLRVARSQGARVVDGLEVLVLQAFRSLEIWLGRTLDPSLVHVMRGAALEALS